MFRVLFVTERKRLFCQGKKRIVYEKKTDEKLCVALLQKQLRLGAEMPD